MRRRFAITALAIAAFVGGSTAGTVRAAPSATAKTCSAGYVHASLPWGQKCLRAGEFCKVGNHAYSKYGFTCPSSGHLKRRK
jgi:hypothetical protein